MLGMLCEMFEPPGRLFTCDHRFVQIDNELMFAQGAGANLLQSDWVREENNIKEDGLKEATILCEAILSLSEEIFDAAIHIPAGYRPQMTWCMKEQIGAIRPRANMFLNYARLILG